MGQDGSGMVDHHTRLHRYRLNRVIVAAPQVIGVPALRHGIPVNAGVGEQSGFSEQFDVFVFFSECVDAHGHRLLSDFTATQHTTVWRG